MEYKKYAPLIGTKLTWEVIEMLAKDIKADIHVANQQRIKARYKLKDKKPVIHTEDDGS